MANFSKATYGEGVTKDVNLVVSVYDTSHWSKEVKGKQRSGVFVQQAIHPDDPRAAGQVYLGLKSIPGDAGQRPNTHENLTPGQFESLVAAAGDNVSPLLDKDGNQVGKNYGVTADVMFNGEKGARYAMFNSKTLKSSDLSVAKVDGKTIQDRIFESQRDAKAARESAKAAGAAPAIAEPIAEPAAEAPQADEPELG